VVVVVVAAEVAAAAAVVVVVAAAVVAAAARGASPHRVWFLVPPLPSEGHDLIVVPRGTVLR
jgi:hypothetical protein